MDLTKVTLPTFILERRSLLEMYADFFAHPDDFIHADELSTPEDRMISVVKYYLNAFYPARKSGVAKKPYNPILGETFRCRWTVPGTQLTGKQTKDGPFPGSDTNQVIPTLRYSSFSTLFLGNIYWRTGQSSSSHFRLLCRTSRKTHFTVSSHLDKVFVFGSFDW